MATTKINTPELFELESSTSAVRLPSGTTAERPSSANAGDFRYNTDNNNVEYYDGSDWFQIDDEALPPIPSENFNTILYVGDGSSQSITGVGFAPDLVVIKNRVTAGKWWTVNDTVRGTGKRIFFNEANAELSDGYDISSFDSDGFTTAGGDFTDRNGEGQIAYCWKAGGASVPNSDGGVASDVSANVNAGFSIVEYTTSLSAGQNTTVGHGLNAIPELIIQKNLSNAYNWWVAIDSISGFSQDDYLQLNSTGSKQNISQPIGRATADVFTISEAFSGSGTQNQIAYCFHSVNGYQKIGTYTGDGNAHGPIVNTGFEPAFVMIKNTTGGDSWDDWYVSTNKTLTSGYLFANDSVAEQPYQAIRMLTNGFQVITTDTGVNENANTYLYLAIASDPTSTTPTLTESFKTTLYTGNGAAQTIGGHLNGSAQFNGSSSYITIPLNQLNNTFTYSTWLFADDLSTSYRWIFGNWASSSQDIYFMLNSNGTLDINPDGNNGTTIFARQSPLTTNIWYHLVVSMNAGTYTVYLDGVSLGSGSTTNTTFNNSNNYQIGKVPNSSINEWSGKMDQIRIYNTALTASQVNQLYNETTATANTLDFPTGAGCIAAYPLDSNSTDLSGNYSGTDTNIFYSPQETSKNPSLVWIKQRTGSNANQLNFDILRGPHMQLMFNTTGSTVDRTSVDKGVANFNSYGFTVKDDSAGNYEINGPNGGTYSGDGTYVAWNWGASTLPAANSAGTVPSIVSVNDTAGFSMLKFAGANGANTCGHGLSTAPELFIMRSYDAGGTWGVYVKDLGADKYLTLNSSVQEQTSTTAWNNTHPTSGPNGVLSWQGGIVAAGAGYNNIAYCFHSVSGYQKIGVYTGNNTTSNTIYTTDDGTSGGANGFEPGWLLIKRVDASANWRILDNKRSTSNPRNKELYPNLSNTELTFSAANFNSTSFEIITTDASYNALNGEYLYLVIK